jgi:2-methylcitrate dehydratase PrpD
MQKIHLEVDHEIEEKTWDRAARVSVDLADNRHESKLVIHFRGTPHNPLAADEVEAKARKLTRGIIRERQLEQLINSISHMEKLVDVSQIGDRLRRS